MREKRVPLRRCTGCGEMKTKTELVRAVKGPNKNDENGKLISRGSVTLDLTGKASGRGAYVCKDSECLNKAIKSQGFERALKTKIPPEVYKKMKEELSFNE